jgi:hypothetical protein
MIKWVLWLVVPIVLGIAAGYGLQQYQCRQVDDAFLPYQTEETETNDPREQFLAFSYIAEPLTRNYGQIDSYRRYTADWDIRNTGRKTLTIDVESATCEVLFDGEPSQHAEVVTDRTVRMTLRWLEDGSRREYTHSVSLKTNDGIESNRRLEFVLNGTVAPTVLVQPSRLVFDPSAGPTRELSSRVYCFNTSKFEIVDSSFSLPALADAYDVSITRVEDAPPVDGKPVASCWEIKVTARADASPPASGSLSLQSNDPEITGLQISIQSR